MCGLLVHLLLRGKTFMPAGMEQPFTWKNTIFLGEDCPMLQWLQVQMPQDPSLKLASIVTNSGTIKSISVGYFNPKFHSLSNTKESQCGFDTHIFYPNLDQLRNEQESSKLLYCKWRLGWKMITMCLELMGYLIHNHGNIGNCPSSLRWGLEHVRTVSFLP